jgi:hypothetical protein
MKMVVVVSVMVIIIGGSDDDDGGGIGSGNEGSGRNPTFWEDCAPLAMQVALVQLQSGNFKIIQRLGGKPGGDMVRVT